MATVLSTAMMDYDAVPLIQHQESHGHHILLSQPGVDPQELWRISRNISCVSVQSPWSCGTNPDSGTVFISQSDETLIVCSQYFWQVVK